MQTLKIWITKSDRSILHSKAKIKKSGRVKLRGKYGDKNYHSHYSTWHCRLFELWVVQQFLYTGLYIHSFFSRQRKDWLTTDTHQQCLNIWKCLIHSTNQFMICNLKKHKREEFRFKEAIYVRNKTMERPRIDVRQSQLGQCLPFDVSEMGSEKACTTLH